MVCDDYEELLAAEEAAEQEQEEAWAELSKWNGVLDKDALDFTWAITGFWREALGFIQTLEPFPTPTEPEPEPEPGEEELDWARAAREATECLDISQEEKEHAREYDEAYERWHEAEVALDEAMDELSHCLDDE
jgi:hypothetical protein